MNYYLSSYQLGKETEKLKQLIQKTSGKFGYIPNALDIPTFDPIRTQERIDYDMADLGNYGVEVELLDLKTYFDQKESLKEKLATLGGVYVSGGNTFVLRQAMKLSGLDELLPEMGNRQDFLYVAYSAGVCVLTENMKSYALTDSAEEFPYPQIKEQIWTGLGILDFVFLPHYQSDHPESESIDREVKYCIDHQLPYKTYRDGEVLIMP